MPYRYVMKWRNGGKESLQVEAWPKSRSLAAQNETKRASFVIGRVTGPRTTLLQGIGRELVAKYPNSHRNQVTKVTFPIDDLVAVADAYRVGLAAAAVSQAPTQSSAEAALKYVIQAQREEVWFWTSKFLHVLGNGIDPAIVVRALSIISGERLRTLPQKH